MPKVSFRQDRCKGCGLCVSVCPKKIIAIEPWGSEKTSVVVKHAADKIVKWNTDSIVKAIRGH